MCEKYDFSPEDILELTPDYDLSDFCCDAGGDDDPFEVNDFIHNHAKAHQEKKLSKTYLFHHEGKLVGVMAMLMGSIEIKDLPVGEAEGLDELPFDYFPALILGQIGTSVGHRRRGVCRGMCGFGVAMASKLSEYVGCRYVALTTSKEIASIYERIGFNRKASNKNRVVMALRLED